MFVARNSIKGLMHHCQYNLRPSMITSASSSTSSTIRRMSSTSDAQNASDKAAEPLVHEQPVNNVSQESSQHHQQQPNKPKIVLFGGNGYVGQGIVSAAIRAGVHVVSVSRSGAPAHYQPPAFAPGSVEWRRGDITQPATYAEALAGATGVISCVGAFGSNEFMEKMNGDANITAISASLQHHVPRFVYISTVENNLPAFVLKGYFSGKRRAEQALLDAFPQTGVVLRPSFVYGTRAVPLPSLTNTNNNSSSSSSSSSSSTSTKSMSVDIPLWLVGQPLQTLFSLSPVQALRRRLPGMQAILAPPVSRDAVAKVAVAAAVGEAARVRGEEGQPPALVGVLSVEDIIELARHIE